MRSVSVRILVVLGLVGGTVGCDLLGNGDEATYPATLRPLSQGELRERISQYHEANDHEICSTLNRFGLTIADGCFAPDEVPEDSLSREEAVTIAKRTLTRNERYTNVGSVDQLRVENMSDISHPDEPGGKEWKVSFKDQVYEGKTVHDTGIFVWLTADGVYRIGGHWYQDIVFPDDPISRSEALDAALGYEIVYSDWTGRDTITVSEDNRPPPDEVEMSILPHEVDDTVELRVVWQFTVADSFFRLYVDGVEGEVLDHQQLVIF